MSTKVKFDADIEELLEEIEISIYSNKLILYNDDTTGMTEVIYQIMKALHTISVSCDYKTAQKLMMTAHTSGKAILFVGSFDLCEKGQSILLEIGLQTGIE